MMSFIDRLLEQRARSAAQQAPRRGMLKALGGASNIMQVESFGPRISLLLEDVGAVATETLHENGFRGMADLGDGRVQLIADSDTNELTRSLKTRV